MVACEARRSDEAAVETMALQEKGGLLDGLKVDCFVKTVNCG
jgi:hypothetical protein